MTFKDDIDYYSKEIENIKKIAKIIDDRKEKYFFNTNSNSQEIVKKICEIVYKNLKNRQKEFLICDNILAALNTENLCDLSEKILPLFEKNLFEQQFKEKFKKNYLKKIEERINNFNFQMTITVLTLINRISLLKEYLLKKINDNKENDELKTLFSHLNERINILMEIFEISDNKVKEIEKNLKIIEELKKIFETWEYPTYNGALVFKNKIFLEFTSVKAKQNLIMTEVKNLPLDEFRKKVEDIENLIKQKNEDIKNFYNKIKKSIDKMNLTGGLKQQFDNYINSVLTNIEKLSKYDINLEQIKGYDESLEELIKNLKNEKQDIIFEIIFELISLDTINIDQIYEKLKNKTNDLTLKQLLDNLLILKEEKILEIKASLI